MRAVLALVVTVIAATVVLAVEIGPTAPPTAGRPVLRPPTQLRLAVPRAITGVPTGVAAFVGETARGPANVPVPVSDYNVWRSNFGTSANPSPMDAAIKGFFENGGRQAYVVRTLPGGLPGSLADRTGIYALEDSPGVVSILVIPEVDDEVVLDAAHRYCRQRRMFLLVDPPADADTVAEVQSWRTVSGGGLRIHENAAVYFPRVLVTDPATGATRTVGPSGFIAGLYARSDRERGVWKAPAGSEAVLHGVTGLAAGLSAPEMEALTAAGVNPLRALPGGGIVAWGGRTAASDPEWKYVPVRRFALYLEKSINQGTQWAVFEPSDEPLWAQVRAATEAFLMDLFRRGAFPATKPEEAFFVRCDRTTMTQADIEAGRLNILVGFAPLKPAEFIVLRITQHTARP